MVSSHDHDLADPPLRIDVRDASLADIDWNCPSLGVRDLALLERLHHERQLRLELGMDLHAAGIEAAMLIVWHTAITPDIRIDSLVQAALHAPPVRRGDDRAPRGKSCSRD